jgi:AmiR/NasT family two-component response regulator
MQRHGCNAEEAFRRLADESRRTKEELRDVAFAMVESVQREPPQRPE